jgi:hypothetical protein
MCILGIHAMQLQTGMYCVPMPRIIERLNDTNFVVHSPQHKRDKQPQLMIVKCDSL